jgi:signal peptidase I
MPDSVAAAPAPGPAAPPTPPPSVAAARRAATSDEGSAKETIESILVAFILAFIFRAFVVEAFVIPTGSMAPTLMGAHMRFRCEDCGYKFDVNYSGRSVGDDVEIPSVARGKEYAAFCPNCGLKVARENRNDPENDATSPAVHYGDRILVLKFSYLLSPPNRWDVVVFKTPDRPQNVAPFTVNYIKRLIGRPGESIFILDGDVYAGRAGDPLDKHVVQTKPRVAQEALWRVVFDGDFQPGRSGWTSPWERGAAGEGWTVVNPTGAGGNAAMAAAAAARVLSFDNQAGAGWLRFNPNAAPEKQALSDWLAYAVTKRQDGVDSYDRGGLLARNHVSDVKLDLFYERKAGDGPLRLQLSKLDDVFTAELTPARVRLLRRDAREPEEAGREIAAADLDGSARAGKDPLHVEFTNADYRVTLRINGRDYLRTTPQEYHPNFERLLSAYRRDEPLPKPEVRIGAERQACALTHVSLWRDVYYTNRDAPYESGGIKWGTPESPMVLGPDDYWVLGDNSLMSGDGRYWGIGVNLPAEALENVQAGVVPGRFMLGKAFFVYWPAGYRPHPSMPGVVPNFAEMRFIH